MTILSVDFQRWGSAKFSATEYAITAVFLVRTSDKNIGPDEIRRLPQFRMGAAYQAGNDSNPALRVVDCDPKQGKPRTNWLVTVSYSSAAPTGGDNQNNSPPGGGGDEGADDMPGSVFEPRMSTRPAWFRKKANSAVFEAVMVQDAGVLSKFSDLLAGVWDKYTGPPIHSNKKPIDPTPEIDVAGITFRQSGAWSKAAAQGYFDSLSPLVGKVNALEMTLANPAGTIKRVCSAGTVRLDSVVLNEHSGSELLIPVSVEWTWKPDGWAEDFADEGATIQVDSLESAGGEVVDQMHRDEVNLRDATGAPVTELTPLDGRGKPNAAFDSMQFFNRYMLEKTVEFPTTAAPYSAAWS